jgi:hypothetical protein
MKELLEIKRQLKKDEIVDLTSRLIKQDDQPSIGGMTEIPTGIGLGEVAEPDAKLKH